MLRHAAQLQQGQAHQQLEDGEEEASDEEEYERALLACTSGRCGGRSNSSHLGMHLPPRAQQAATAAAVVVEMAGQSAADNPEGLQQLSGLSSGASVRCAGRTASHLLNVAWHTNRAANINPLLHQHGCHPLQ